MGVVVDLVPADSRKHVAFDVVIDWDQLLWWLMVIAAVGGGVLSVAAYWFQRASPESRKTGDRMYIVSYVLMSISVLLFAARGMID